MLDKILNPVALSPRSWELWKQYLQNRGCYVVKDFSGKNSEDFLSKDEVIELYNSDKILVIYGIKTKSKHQQLVEHFIKLAGRDVPPKPQIVSLDLRKLCARLILEEALETIRDGLGLDSMGLPDDAKRVIWSETNSGPDLVALAGGCFDTRYICTYTLSTFGIPDYGQEIIDLNNLDKFPSKVDANGKVVKPVEFVGPKIREWIEELSK